MGVPKRTSTRLGGRQLLSSGSRKISQVHDAQKWFMCCRFSKTKLES